ncbi:MAG TPA: response regulator, partial [Persephonella sp.]|nr:response regulator [Persephonella sp.]
EVSEDEVKREGKFKILILDDSPVARKIIRGILEKDGHEIIEAQNGIEGLKLLEKLLEEAKEDGIDITDKIQLIVSDIEMPGMDGLTFTRKVKEHPEFSKIPVIINTSLSDKATVDKAKMVNADAHLVKFDAPDLLKLVHKYAVKKINNKEV